MARRVLCFRHWFPSLRVIARSEANWYMRFRGAVRIIRVRNSLTCDYHRNHPNRPDDPLPLNYVCAYCRLCLSRWTASKSSDNSNVKFIFFEDLKHEFRTVLGELALFLNQPLTTEVYMIYIYLYIIWVIVMYSRLSKLVKASLIYVHIYVSLNSFALIRMYDFCDS